MVVFGFVCVCDGGQEVVFYVELFVDAVEECLAEWSALEIEDGAVEKVNAGCDVRVLDVFSVGEDAESSFEGVDTVHVEQG